MVAGRWDGSYLAGGVMRGEREGGAGTGGGGRGGPRRSGGGAGRRRGRGGGADASIDETSELGDTDDLGGLFVL